MKKSLYILLALAGLFIASCTDDNIAPSDETAGLVKVTELTNDTQTVELYTETGTLEAGYNKIYLRIREVATGTFINPATIMWMPVMDMMSMDHSCPRSPVEKVPGKTNIYAGYAVFQMPGNPSEGWNLTITFQNGSNMHQVKGNIDVANPARKRVSVVTGSDTKKYIIAMVKPSAPVVGLNELVIGIYTMQDMMTFPAVENYKLSIDPRMPSMGNHGSPSNVDPVYDAADMFYHGTLSLSMTGYWKINMILKDSADAILKGEEISGPVESSSLYLEVEF